jgi:Na+-driven multidrug efflux pump
MFDSGTYHSLLKLAIPLVLIQAGQRIGSEGLWYGFLAGLIVAGILLSLRIRKKICQLEGLAQAF